MIRAIQTKYRGCHFRSRLEARWAVFFDAAGIKWLYEQEGYWVDGVPYLPDFYLPQFGYFEVKGRRDCDLDMMQKFSDESGELVILAFEEIPFPENGRGYLETLTPGSFHEGGDLMFWGYDDMFLQCDGCGKVTIQNAAYDTIKGNCCDGSREMSIEHALLAAREARFEHGEKPNV